MYFCSCEPLSCYIYDLSKFMLLWVNIMFFKLKVVSCMRRFNGILELLVISWKLSEQCCTIFGSNSSNLLYFYLFFWIAKK